jgi:hypothetical protein
MGSTGIVCRRAFTTHKVACALSELCYTIESAGATVQIAALMRSTGIACRRAFTTHKVACALSELCYTIESAGATVQITALMRSASIICYCALTTFKVPSCTLRKLCQAIKGTSTAI